MTYDKVKDSQKRIRERNRAFLIEYLKEHPCSSCGEQDLLVLDLDHVDPATKKYNVSRMVSSQHHSIKKIQEEIDKCQVLCANCHRRKTYKERGIMWFD